MKPSKKTQKGGYNLIKWKVKVNGEVVDLTPSKGESEILTILRIILSRLNSLKPVYEKMLVRIIGEVKINGISWREIGDNILIPRASMYRKLKARTFNIFDIQLMRNYLDYRYQIENGDKIRKSFSEQSHELIRFRQIVYGTKQRSFPQERAITNAVKNKVKKLVEELSRTNTNISEEP